MNANISIQATPNIAGNNFVVSIAAASAPTIILQTIYAPPPYFQVVGGVATEIPFQVTFVNLKSILYNITLWESPNQTATGRIANAMSLQVAAGMGIVTLRNDLYLTGGSSAGFNTGSYTYSDPSLLPFIYDVERIGYGTIQEGVDYTQDLINGGFTLVLPIQVGEKYCVHFQPQAQGASQRRDLYLTCNTSQNFTSNTNIYVNGTLIAWDWDLEQIGYGTLEIGKDYTQDNGGGFTMINGAQFQDDQQFVIHFLPRFATTITPPSSYTGNLILTDNISLTKDAISNAIFLQGASTSFIVNLPPLSTISDYDVLNFFSAGGNHINVSLRCSGSDLMQRNVLVTKIVLAQNEQLKIFKALGVWMIAYVSPSVDMVGRIIKSYDINEPNCVMANGVLLLRATYERLSDKALALPVGVLVSDNAWPSNNACYTNGTNGSDFRLPLLSTYGILKGVDGINQLAGSYEGQNVGQHDHITHGKGGINNDRYLTISNSRFSGGGGDPFGGDTSPDPNMRTGDNNQDPKNKVDSTGVYFLIHI